METPNRLKLAMNDLGTVALMATVALAVGVFGNQLRDKPMPLVYQTKTERVLTAAAKMAAPPRGSPEVERAAVPEMIELEDFKTLLGDPQVLVLDARPEIFHRLGHVPGAVSLPRDDFENVYQQLRAKLEEDKERRIVIYCASYSCKDAEILRKGLEALGYTQLTVFGGGWAEWTSAGMPEERND